jgi:hypothetical protein
MKKKIYVIIGLIVVLGAAAVILVTRNSNSTINKELRDFAVEDTAYVDRVFMVRKDNQSVMLERDGNHWVVNGKYPVRPDAIETLLKTLKRIRIKSPVSNSALDNTVRMLATRNTKVEVYHGKKLLKTIYVGGPTQDQMGTFMMLEGSSVPFIIHIPGFIGYLSTRFFVDESGWRSTSIFNYNFPDIKAISVVNPSNPESSFKVGNPGGNRYELFHPDGTPVNARIDTTSIKFYISQFEKVNFEFFADSLPQNTKDSLLAAPPYRILTLDDNSGRVRKVVAWKRPGMGKLDDNGNPLKWDDERMWALLDDQTWVVIQYYVFNSLFGDISKFIIPGH